ncbi:potassium-transporting ATPase subunit KdpC [Paenibacillus eucommiae]|uniref:Potassium-transporting ATPase KdpC subunit n=1 Tax=Paenibacillus eucommiae TaxID=1355755 RepID=A0ABS4ITP8_9BACL|nr:potassium-transporting ATPase subunit KdpC [Paenibacillus eucommiae]MBP1989954.1 K+-transporting ATPase ATPase C chain [Paenibacillus eucommiae]
MNKTSHPVMTGGAYLFTIVRIGILFIVLCGILYPLVCTGIAQVLMPGKANSSLLTNSSGVIIGSEMIGQSFTDPRYFHGRVSSIDYKAEASGTNNYGPSNPELLKRTQASIELWKTNNPDVPVSQLPIDLITNSGSGLDPHITPESAEVQIPRISKVTGISSGQLEQLINKHTEARDLGIFGEPRVNVLKLNIALDELIGK